ncbi:MAG: prepilin-type N-terminal cleavage/methylation domain [Thermoleophilia bacterium]|nr:prepilin-type N-terminal cleavage/methylation domain [Thermoleophilia bacterium]
MLARLRERSEAENGFTLIELLVVMIIIAILMAVAVPTFLAQKNTAQKTKATANIKQVVNAIESCSANNTDGTYTNCNTWALLTTYEKALVNLKNGTGVGQYQVTFNNPPTAYVVTGTISDAGKTVVFSEVHGADGSLFKGCGAAGLPITTTKAPTTGVVGSKTCTNGNWG